MTEQGASQTSRVSLILKVVAICAMLPLALSPFFYAGKIIAYFPYSIDREEAFLLKQATDLRDGASIYRDIAGEPYLVGNYPPVYPWIVSIVLRMGGEGLGAGRAVSAIACAGIALCMGAIVWRVNRDWFAATLAPMLFLAGYEVEYWIPFARVDLTALLLTALGLFLFVASEKRAWLTASAVAFAFAVYTKQTEVLAPIACGGALLLRRRFAEAGIFAAVLGGLCLLVLLSLNVATSGQFWNHAVTYNHNAMRWELAFRLWKHIGGLFGWEILAGASLLAINGRILFTTRERSALVLFAFLSTFSILSTSKVGSDVNYLLVPEVALATLVGALLPLPQSIKAFSIAPYLLVAVHIAHTWMPGIQQIIGKEPPGRTSRNNSDAILLEVNGTMGEVLSEDAAFLLMDRRPVVYQPFIMTQLAREGKWDQTNFVNDLHRARFSLIVTMSCLGPDCAVPGFTDEMRAAILESYQLFQVIPVYPNQQRFLYIPKHRRDEVHEAR
ncbi:glycosyltransferase family 39 protein [Candidatus Sumerlaeota bacterium]|nr:glycosyltransferase family 39 protein [Candidatus Sumerlaeota bacterium]